MIPETWTPVRRSDDDAGGACRLTLSEPIGSGTDAVALGAQRLAARLADAMAASVATLSAGKPLACTAAA